MSESRIGVGEKLLDLAGDKPGSIGRREMSDVLRGSEPQRMHVHTGEYVGYQSHFLDGVVELHDRRRLVQAALSLLVVSQRR